MSEAKPQEKRNKNSMDEDSSDWGGLPMEILINIISRLTIQERWTGPMFVRKSWLNVCRDPYLWSIFDLEQWFESYPESTRWWSPDFERKVDSMLRLVVDWSDGGLTEIRIRHCSDQSLSYAADRMARTKNANYGRGESPNDGGENLERRIVVAGSRVVYEDPTDSEQEGNSSRTVSDKDSTDSGEETEALQPMQMYFQPSEYTKKIKIPTRCYITEAVETLDNLKYPLRVDEKRWFHRHPQFKHFFHISKDKNHKVMGLWMLLVRTVRTERKREAWFLVNGTPIRYGIREHALISGLDCRNYPVNYQSRGSMDFIEKHFGRGAKVRYADVKEKLKGMRPSQDRLKMAVLYFLSSIIIGQTKTGEDAPAVEPFFQRAVSDLDLCKTFPWGRLSFDHIMREISHTMDHFRGVVKGTQWTMPIFCTPLELLAFEAIPELRKKFREDVSGADSTCPRMCKTKFKRSAMKGFTLDEINESLGSTKDIESILVASPDEEGLLSEIYEVEDVEDNDDVIIRSWTKRLLHDKKPVFFEEIFNEDVASRAEPVNAPDAPLAPHTPIAEQMENAASENAPMTAFVELMKKMEEGFKKVHEKIEKLDERNAEVYTKVVFLEEYVKDKLETTRLYEEMYRGGVGEHETDLQRSPRQEDRQEDRKDDVDEDRADDRNIETCEKDGDVEKSVEKGVERSPTTDDDTTVDIGMGSKDGDEAICGGKGDLEVESAKIPEPREIPTEDATKDATEDATKDATEDATEERTIQRTFTRKRKRNPSGAVKTPYTRWPTRRRNAD